MTAVAIAPVDLAPFAEIAEAKAQAMIADALAMAAVVAPCIAESEFSVVGHVIPQGLLSRNSPGVGLVLVLPVGAGVV